MSLERGTERAARIYRRLLRLYPSEFRRRVGEDAVELFRDRYRECRQERGPLGRLLFWPRAVANVVVHGLAERWGTWRRPRFSGLGSSGRVTNAGGLPLNGWMRDLRYALRTLSRRPGHAAVVVVTLGVGMGVTVAIFTLFNRVLIQPLPFDDPDRLVTIWESNPRLGLMREGPAPGNVLSWREGASLLDGIAAWYTRSATFRDDDRAEDLMTARITAEFFRVLGVEAAMGRTFAREEGGRGERSVVLSDGVWRRLLGADPGIIGRTIGVDGASHQVVGVMPASFSFPDPAVDLWVALDFRHTYARLPAIPRDWRFLRTVARLSPGATVEQAARELTSVAGELAERFPDTNRGWGVTLRGLHEETVGDTRSALFMMIGAAGFVLLLASANVANILLARAPERSGEVAVRVALGATRGGIVRQLLLENLTLGLAGGLVGVILAWGMVHTIVTLDAGTIPRLDNVRIDIVSAAFAGLLSVGTTVLFGFGPILFALRTGTTQAMRRVGRSPGAHGGPGQARLRDALVASEVATALVLVVGAGVFGRSLMALHTRELGFERDNVLTLRIALDPRDDPGFINRYYEQLLQSLSALPGVEAVGATTALPLDPVGNDFNRPYRNIGDRRPASEAPKTQVRVVTPGYRQTMGIPLLAGRDFSASDLARTRPVVMVNDVMARELRGDERVVGTSVAVNFRDGWQTYEVVGVVRAVNHQSPREAARPEIFFPLAQVPYLAMSVAVRTATPADAYVEPVRRVVQRTDATQPAARYVTLSTLFARSVAQDRFVVGLFVVLAGIGMVLAGSGVYGLLAYMVSRRTHEIGVRLALGAERAAVIGIVTRRALLVAGIGIAVGLVLTGLLGRAVQSLLFGVTAADPMLLAGAAALLFALAGVAAYRPARRAAGVDPVTALRSE